MRKQRQIPTIILIALAFAGCAVLPGNDPVLVDAQKTVQTAHQTFDFLFKLERDNEAWSIKYAPSVHKAVNNLRKSAPKAEDNAWAAIEVYRTNRTPENKANLDTWIATLNKLLSEASGYVAQLNAASTKTL